MLGGGGGGEGGWFGDRWGHFLMKKGPTLTIIAAQT